MKTTLSILSALIFAGTTGVLAEVPSKPGEAIPEANKPKVTTEEFAKDKAKIQGDKEQLKKDREELKAARAQRKADRKQLHKDRKEMRRKHRQQ